MSRTPYFGSASSAALRSPVESPSAAGAAVALGQGAGPPLQSRHGKGPALEGPYLDLRTGRGNQIAYARMLGDVDFGKQTYFWFKGYIMSVEPGKKIQDLLGAAGFGAIRLKQRPDGSIERLCREIITYTDLRSDEVLEEWNNPLTGERVRAVHVDNDPFNYVLEDTFPLPPKFGELNKDDKPPRVPFILPWYQHGNKVSVEIHMHLAYPSALQPDKWPRESAGPIAQVSEMFAHHVSAADVQNPKVTALEYEGTWNRITPWLPWMLMGQRPGHMLYACLMGKCRDLESVLPRSVLDYAHKHYAKYFDAPTEWSAQPSLSSLEHYAHSQKPAPVKA